MNGSDAKPLASSAHRVYHGDNLSVLQSFPDACTRLIYVDPPFNTGKLQRRDVLRTERSSEGNRTGFQGRRYATEKMATHGFLDIFDDYLGFLEPRLIEAYRVL